MGPSMSSSTRILSNYGVSDRPLCTVRSPEKPVLVFVASRRQTRLTALDLISLCARDANPRRFVRMPEEEAQNASESVR